jgi:hypothetical protein
MLALERQSGARARGNRAGASDRRAG